MGYEESVSLPYDFTYDTCIHTLNFVVAPVSAILVQQSEVYLVGCFPRYSEVPRRSRHGPGKAIPKPCDKASSQWMNLVLGN